MSHQNGQGWNSTRKLRLDSNEAVFQIILYMIWKLRTSQTTNNFCNNTILNGISELDLLAPQIATQIATVIEDSTTLSENEIC